MVRKKTIIPIYERSERGKSSSRRYRRQGKIPCIVYGHGEKGKTYYIEEKVWKDIPIADVHLVELKTSEGSSINALIKDIQFDYLAGKTLHVDFQEVRMDELVEAEVPVHGVGTPIGLSHGGFLEQVLHKIKIQCLPASIPAAIEVDISNLELEAALHVGDIKLPEGVKALTPATQIVFHVLTPKTEEETTTTTTETKAEAQAEPELVGGKGKTVEEGAENKESKESAKEKERK